MPARLIFIDKKGREWLVRDGLVQEGKFIPLTLGDSYAAFGVFDCKAPRLRKVYRFPQGLQHAVEGARLEVQFLEARSIQRRKGG
ncbi:MAG: hypothetical protein ACJ796_07755 [Gemmatimonadaceae bacterium]